MPPEITGAETVRWDLSCLYASIDDPALGRDIEQWAKRARQFHTTYRGRLHDMLEFAIHDYASLSMLENTIIGYLRLQQSTLSDDQNIKAKISETERTLASANADWLTFFEHELVALDDAAIYAQAATSAIVAKHLPFILH